MKTIRQHLEDYHQKQKEQTRQMIELREGNSKNWQRLYDHHNGINLGESEFLDTLTDKDTDIYHAIKERKFTTTHKNFLIFFKLNSGTYEFCPFRIGEDYDEVVTRFYTEKFDINKLYIPQDKKDFLIDRGINVFFNSDDEIYILTHDERKVNVEQDNLESFIDGLMFGYYI